MLCGVSSLNERRPRTRQRSEHDFSDAIHSHVFFMPMKRPLSHRIFFSAVAVLAGAITLAASPKPQPPPAPPPQAQPQPTQFRQWTNNAFGVGEKLTFNLSYGFVTAGHAIMSIPGYKYVNGRKTFETRIEANSSSGFDWIFRVRDRYETFMDVEGIFPWRFEQHVREGNYSKDYNAFFDPIEQTAEGSDGQRYQTPQYVHDIVSAFYYVRTMDLTHSRRGDVIHLQNFFDGKTHPLDVRVLGHQPVETDIGTFNCVVIEPMVVQGGLFKNEGSIKIWLTDDDNHMPVQMASRVIVGEIKATLAKYEGVRNTLAAKTGG